MMLHGIGIGLAQQVPILGVQNAAPARDVGAATGAVTLSRMGGASIAISIYGAIIGAQLPGSERSIPGVADIKQMTPKMMARTAGCRAPGGGRYMRPRSRRCS